MSQRERRHRPAGIARFRSLSVAAFPAQGEGGAVVPPPAPIHRKVRKSGVDVKTLDLHEAAVFLHMHPEEVRTRAKRGLIPGAKTGRRWIFLDAISLSSCARCILLGGKRCE